MDWGRFMAKNICKFSKKKFPQKFLYLILNWPALCFKISRTTEHFQKRFSPFYSEWIGEGLWLKIFASSLKKKFPKNFYILSLIGQRCVLRSPELLNIFKNGFHHSIQNGLGKVYG